MNRRSFIAASTSALAATHLRASAFNMDTPKASFDHIIYAISNLQAGIKSVKEKTGVEASFGGKHPHLGTQNALLSLGSDVYLEILSPDPNGKLIDDYKFITDLNEGKLIMWAAHTNDIQALLKAATDNGYKNSGINDGQRNTSDGKILRWKTLMVSTEVDEVMPFFIQWGTDTPHPATTSPKGCTLRALKLTHPNPDLVKKTFATFGLNNEVENGAAGMSIKIATPNGEITL